ncbi:hypothetical protein MKX62_08805 [Sporosarcina sp. FSL K6-5500]
MNQIVMYVQHIEGFYYSFNYVSRTNNKTLQRSIYHSALKGVRFFDI